jgi:EmrB/QacA subfamily drug resistance transporter
MKKDNYKWIALSCTTLGALMSVMNGSTLIIALPIMMKDLNLDMGTVTWILMEYLLILTVLVPTIGRLADIAGRKKLYVSGFALFTFASLLCALSNSGIQLLIFRFVQGVGGALMLANSTTIVADAFPKNELGKALGVNSMVISVGNVIGPILGGFLVSIGWRSIFYINIPIGVLGTIWSFIQLKELIKIPEKQKFDFLGTILFTLGMFLLLVSLTLGSFSGWLNPVVIIMIIASIIIIGLFIHVEKNTQYPMIDLRLLNTRILAFANASNFFNGIARGAVSFLLVFYLQGIKSMDPILAGIYLTPLAISMFIISPISGHLSDKVGSRALSSIGLIITAIGLLGFMTIGASTPMYLIIIYMLIIGLGSGLFFSPNTNAIMGSVPAHKRGVAAGLRTMLNTCGSLLSISLSMAIISSSVTPKAMQALFVGTQVGSQGIAIDNFIGGLRLAFGISFAFSIIGAVLSYMRGPQPKWDSIEESQSA